MKLGFILSFFFLFIFFATSLPAERSTQTMDENELWCIIFVSIVSKETSPEMLQGFVETKREERISDNRTGLTIFSDGNLLVLIEGSKETVQKGFQNAQLNGRYHSPVKLYDGPASDRFFANHPLALKILKPEQYRHLDDFKTEEMQKYFADFVSSKHIIPRMVLNFLKNNS